MSGRMDTGVQDLVFPDQRKFIRGEFLNLRYEITFPIDSFCIVNDFSSCFHISCIRESGSIPSILLDPDLMSVMDDGVDLCRRSYYAIFPLFYVF